MKTIEELQAEFDQKIEEAKVTCDKARDAKWDAELKYHEAKAALEELNENRGYIHTRKWRHGHRTNYKDDTEIHYWILRTLGTAANVELIPRPNMKRDKFKVIEAVWADSGCYDTVIPKRKERKNFQTEEEARSYVKEVMEKLEKEIRESEKYKDLDCELIESGIEEIE